jgi:hypothetical protein
MMMLTERGKDYLVLNLYYSISTVCRRPHRAPSFCQPPDAPLRIRSHLCRRHHRLPAPQHPPLRSSSRSQSRTTQSVPPPRHPRPPCRAHPVSRFPTTPTAHATDCRWKVSGARPPLAWRYQNRPSTHASLHQWKVSGPRIPLTCALRNSPLAQRDGRYAGGS